MDKPPIKKMVSYPSLHLRRICSCILNNNVIMQEYPIMALFRTEPVLMRPQKKVDIIKWSLYINRMSRTKEYDRQEVLSKAISVFWKKGFEATSMSELIETTGLNSASLYKEFGSKEGLYETALENYREKELEPFIRPLIDEPNMKGIEKFLKGAVKNATHPDFKGCLMMNTLAEKEVVGPGAVSRVEKFCIRLETVFEGAIRGAQKSGDIPTRKDPVALAHYLLCLVQGMVLYGRVEDHKPHIKTVINMVKEALAG